MVSIISFNAYKLSEIQTCYNENSFSLNETVFSGTVETKDIFQNMSNWIVDNTNVMQGQCHTFKYPTPIKAETLETAIKIKLDSNSTSTLVFLYDPNFFVLIGNDGKFFPRVLKRYYKVGKMQKDQ